MVGYRSFSDFINNPGIKGSFWRELASQRTAFQGLYFLEELNRKFMLSEVGFFAVLGNDKV